MRGPVRTSAEQAVSDSTEQAVTAGEAAPAAGEAAPASGQAAAAGQPAAPSPDSPPVLPTSPALPPPPPTSPRPSPSPPTSRHPSSLLLTSPPPTYPPHTSTSPNPTHLSPPLQKCPVTIPSPPRVPAPPVPPVKSKKCQPRPAPSLSLDQDPCSQVECPICYKLIQPRLMANHAKYFHVTSDLGVECPKCQCEFIATKIFSHLMESHIVK